MSSLSVRLPDELRRKLDEVAESEQTNRSEIVRQALSNYLKLREFRQLRQKMIPRAESQGIYTDEDVFEKLS